MWALDPHGRSERFECKGREWLAKDSCPWRKLNSLDIQQIESIVARNRRGKYIFLRHAGPDKFDLVLKSEAGIWMRIWFSKKLERRVWRMDAALQRLRCYCTIASETKQQHEAEFPDAQRSCKCLQFEQLWALWSLASGFEEIKLVCSSWSVTWRKTNDGSKMKHPVHETDFSVGTNFFFSEFGQGVHRQCLSVLGDTAIAAWECSQQTWKHLLAVVTHGHGDIWMGEGRALGEES